MDRFTRRAPSSGRTSTSRACLIGLFGSALLAGCAVETTSAQTRWLPPRNGNAIVVEVLKPSFDGGGVGFLSTATVITGYFDIGGQQRTFLTFDAPVAHLGVDGGESETAIGNPYVGLTAFDADDPVIYEIGLRVPIASDNSGGITGLVSDFDRFEAYASSNFSASAAMSYFPSRSGDWVLQTRLGPTFLLDTDPDEFDAAADLLINYAVISWYFAGAFQGGFGLSGRLLLTDDGTLGERITHQVALTGQFDVGNVIPGLHVRLPLDDDLRDIVDVVFGVSVTVPL